MLEYAYKKLEQSNPLVQFVPNPRSCIILTRGNMLLRQDHKVDMSQVYSSQKIYFPDLKCPRTYIMLFVTFANCTEISELYNILYEQEIIWAFAKWFSWQKEVEYVISVLIYLVSSISPKSSKIHTANLLDVYVESNIK